VAIFVSHDQIDVRSFAENVVLMENGRVIAAGPTTSTLDNAFQRGSSSMTTPTNVVAVSQARIVDGVIHAKLGENLAVIPHPATFDGSERISISFRPSDVMISRQDVEGLSVRNSWHGVVTQIVAAADRMFLQVELGESIWAEITSEALHSLHLHLGDSVVCHIKSTAIEVIS